jgi:uncharacterized protein YcsI (UPF0317 family)
MVDHRFVVNFRSHLPFVAADGIPIQFVAFNLVDRSGLPMPDAGGAPAIHIHVWWSSFKTPGAEIHRMEPEVIYTNAPRSAPVASR